MPLGRDRTINDMILSIHYGGKYHYAESLTDMNELIAEVLGSLPGESGEGHAWTPGEDAWLSLAEQRHSDENPVADNFLRLAVNRRTGYGALIWFVTQESPRKGNIYKQVWISNNIEPPTMDPRVVSDPGYPLFHDPRSTLPLELIHATVNEFLRTGTGERPACIDWTPGHVNGQRLDSPPIVQKVDTQDPFA